MIYPENFEEKTGFLRIRNWLKDLCLSSLGSNNVDKMHFLTSFEAIDVSTGQADEMRNICLMESNFPSNDYYDTTKMLRNIAIPGTFPSIEDIFELKKSIETIHDILVFLRENENKYPLLFGLTDGVIFFPDIVKAIARIVDHQGLLRDNASPELYDIRRSIAEKQTTVLRAMQRIIKKAQADGLVDEGVAPSIRDGRSVIPVNSSFKRKINGIVHDESTTGRTSYIEPAEIVSINNAIRELQCAEQREIVRILTDFADFIRPRTYELNKAFDLLGNIDFIRAKALFAIKINAVKPSFYPQQNFEWQKARHPIMYVNFKKEKREVVPLNIRLSTQERLMLISGPNAGGKSVCLKTVGLLQYMFQCGLLVSMSENSEIGMFDAIYIDIGDEQSIDNDLSTYSSHLLNMRQFLQHANARTLALIDEFGSGTEPVIGGAIAEATLDGLNRKGVWGVITTHYSNLKHFAAETDGITNGAMLFDSNIMKPLFRLETGKPGSSFAFEIARKIGFPEEILSIAAEKAGHQRVDFEKRLSDIEREKTYWERKSEEVQRREKLIEEITEKKIAELEAINKERKKIIECAKEEAQKILVDSNRMIENTIRKIKENQAEKIVTKETRKELDDFKQLLYTENKPKNNKKNSTKEKIVDKIIKKGDAVRLYELQTVGEVIEINDKQITVALGNLLSTIPIDKLEKVSKSELKKQSPRCSGMPTTQTYDLGERRLHFKSQIDVRGMRTQDAIPKVEELVDDAAMLNISEVRILHGKGNGILRQMIRQHLKISKLVENFEDENIQQGGTGITVVKILKL